MHLLKHSRRGNGSVHVAVDLACAQADAGHEVFLASGGGSYDDLLAAHGVRVVRLPEATGVRQALGSARALLSASRRIRPDIMHAHMMSSAVIAYPVSKAVRAALVTTMHNSFDRHSVFMRLGKVVIAVSDAERRLLLSRGYPATQVVTVLNGTAGSAREQLPLDDIGELRRPGIITLSGLHKRKAVGDVITAFADLHPTLPEWHLNIVGGGPDRAELESRVDGLGLRDSVHFMGSTLTPRPLLDAAEIFATASLADPCPLGVMEARVAGCAVVGTAVGGIPEILEHGAAGQLVPSSDPVAMAAALRTLMSDPETLAAWRAKALAGSDYFSIRRVAGDHERVYRSVLRTSRRRASGGTTSSAA
ncbi:glycosyltransferase family 4 protein [uncultured Amnibacterium sp.]|uniref:glycosyltransferase family 4 protein n=1 Tax=uncultured Amnibacterium sp. TaxID=1631851 RepID=UPI0035CBF604